MGNICKENRFFKEHFNNQNNDKNTKNNMYILLFLIFIMLFGALIFYVKKKKR